MNNNDNFVEEAQLLDKDLANHTSISTLDENNILLSEHSPDNAFNNTLNRDLDAISNLAAEIAQGIITVPETSDAALNHENLLFEAEYSLDIDGNGHLSSSDYTLVNLYASFGGDARLFDAFLQSNSDVLLGAGATRTTGE